MTTMRAIRNVTCCVPLLLFGCAEPEAPEADGRPASAMTAGDTGEEWPFDKPFHLILNVAVGGAWGRAGGPIDETVFPQRMLVDYVRVYERGNQ